MNLLIRSKASERRRHQKRRLMKGGLPKAKTRRARGLVAGARSKAHIHSAFTRMNPGLERSIEFGIEKEAGPQKMVFHDGFHNDADLVTIHATQFKLYFVAEHLADAALAYAVDSGVPKLVNHIPPL